MPQYGMKIKSISISYEDLVKMWPQTCTEDFSKIWSCDLASDPKWPSFKSDLNFNLGQIL